jgi:hypothetical protein
MRMSTGTQETFGSSVLRPYERSDESEVPAMFILNAKGKWSTTSLYIDSFGRASVHLPLQLVFSSKSIMDAFINEKCIQPAPVNASVVEDNPIDSATSGVPEKVISLEAKVNLTFGTGHAITARVESVSILSTRIEEDGHSIVLESEVILRVSNVDEAMADGGIGIMDPLEAAKVKTNLEITAALIEKSPLLSSAPVEESVRRDLQSALHPEHHRVAPLTTRTPPLSLQVALIHALELQIRSIPGPTMGHTLVAVQMAHSNRHPHVLRITNIALHLDSSSGITGSNIKNSVQWNFFPEQVREEFPLLLPRNEAHSTILSINATNDACAGSCSGPFTISLTIGSSHRPIVISTNVNWTTRCVAVEDSDSFRISMNVENQDGAHISVGSPFNVNLEIFNLSSEARHLKLLLDNNDIKSKGKGRWTVVSDRDGHKFSLGGPDGERHMLPVDTALLVGDVKGFSSTHAKLRLIPLQRGAFYIPNFKLVDSRSGNCYQCVHKLQAVIY